MITENGETIFEFEYGTKCALCGTAFELGWYKDRILCTECAKALKDKEVENDR